MMSFRFSRRITIAPGIRLNLSAGGVSGSVGIRGASVTLGKRGVYQNIGIPGIGLSYRSRLDSPNDYPSQNISSNIPHELSVQLILHDDGRLDITDSNGMSYSPDLLNEIKSTVITTIDRFLEENCNARNEQLKNILRVHISTSVPTSQITYEPIPFDEARPLSPLLKKHGLLSLIFKKIRKNIDLFNEEQTQSFNLAMQEWQARKDNHDNAENEIRALYDIERMISKEGMAKCLEHRISQINWPLETEMSCDFSDDMKTVWMDVDLPEVGNMPTQSATVSSRPLGLNLKKISDTGIRRNYMQHTHGILFRLIGEAFACLQKIQKVVISGYSQRPNKATGQIEDEYLISLKVDRNEWGTLNFDNLDLIDLVAAFDRFELRRNMTKTGVFKPIEPFIAG